MHIIKYALEKAVNNLTLQLYWNYLCNNVNYWEKKFPQSQLVFDKDLFLNNFMKETILEYIFSYSFRTNKRLGNK